MVRWVQIMSSSRRAAAGHAVQPDVVRRVVDAGLGRACGERAPDRVEGRDLRFVASRPVVEVTVDVRVGLDLAVPPAVVRRRPDRPVAGGARPQPLGDVVPARVPHVVGDVVPAHRRTTIGVGGHEVWVTACSRRRGGLCASDVEREHSQSEGQCTDEGLGRRRGCHRFPVVLFGCSCGPPARSPCDYRPRRPVFGGGMTAEAVWDRRRCQTGVAKRWSRGRRRAAALAEVRTASRVWSQPLSSSQGRS